MQKIAELTKPPIVGNNYLVRCVKSFAANWTDGNRTIPVLGDFHFDKEIICFPEEHIHVDFRFISKSEIKQLKAAKVFFGYVISKKFVEFESWETRRCNRPMPKYPEQTNERHIIWMPELEQAYQDKQITCGRCPHKGIDLNTISGDRLGNKVCPAHGLKWDRQGQLIVRCS